MPTAEVCLASPAKLFGVAKGHLSYYTTYRTLPTGSNACEMRLLQWASLGLLTSATADLNLTHESRNILPSTFKPPQHFRNVNLVRNINLDKSYARETVNVVIENIDKGAQSEYYIPFEQGTIGRVGGLEVRDKKDPEKGGFLTEVAEVDPYRYAAGGDAYVRASS